MTKIFIAMLAAANVLGGVSAALADAGAGTSNANLIVDATVKEGCSINFGGGDGRVSFGTISALSHELVEHSSFNVTCSALKGQTDGYIALPVRLSAGSGRGSAAQIRYLDNGDSSSDTLAFQVFQGNVGNSSGGRIWGDGSVQGTFDAYPVDVQSTPVTGGQANYAFTVILLAKPDMTKNSAGTYQSVMTATVDYSKACSIFLLHGAPICG